MVRQAERSAATIEAILEAARALFSDAGYEVVPIDQIAERAGCKKGAVYHNFSSKRLIFETVLERVQAGLAAGLVAEVRRAFADRSPVLMARCIQTYLEGANGPEIRQILLVDGPVVLGWKRWREIDDRHLAGMVRDGVSLLMEGSSTDLAAIEAATRLTIGAIMETALACSSALDPSAAIEQYSVPFELMLRGFALARQPN